MKDRIVPPSHVYIAASKISGAGRGVFASTKIPKGSLIERCPVVVLPRRGDRARLRKTDLVKYYFLWGKDRDRAAICLGWGSIYNHSYEPNAEYSKLVEGDYMDFIALSDIEEGQEITVNYNGDAKNIAPSLVPGIPQADGTPFRPLSRVTRYLRLLRREVLKWVR